ncbi:hypothetical protein OI18_21120 [Flavihumibacter solisilvae]|uniref:Uncharacterized protein n=1 Tax=Flavihumibacter solisilvae TaxID=1349421 RepID=A0A0C1LB55_9BACT|nr:hypothetical protein OI18_21120 [Flavihumibacter solisilvae]
MIDYFTKVSEILHSGVVIALSNTLEPKFKIVDHFIIKLCDRKVGHFILPANKLLCMSNGCFVALNGCWCKLGTNKFIKPVIVLLKNFQNHFPFIALPANKMCLDI